MSRVSSRRHLKCCGRDDDEHEARQAIRAISTVSSREPGKMIGRPGTTPCSLPDAINEPENVTEPITAPSTTKIAVETVHAQPIPTTRM